MVIPVCRGSHSGVWPILVKVCNTYVDSRATVLCEDGAAYPCASQQALYFCGWAATPEFVISEPPLGMACKPSGPCLLAASAASQMDPGLMFSMPWLIQTRFSKSGSGWCTTGPLVPSRAGFTARWVTLWSSIVEHWKKPTGKAGASWKLLAARLHLTYSRPESSAMLWSNPCVNARQSRQQEREGYLYWSVEGLDWIRDAWLYCAGYVQWVSANGYNPKNQHIHCSYRFLWGFPGSRTETSFETTMCLAIAMPKHPKPSPGSTPLSLPATSWTSTRSGGLLLHPKD